MRIFQSSTVCSTVAMDSGDAARFALAACGILSVLSIAYLVRLNVMLKGTPAEARGIVTPWTEELRRKAYKELENNPVDWTADLPPKLDRRYIITGGNGEWWPHLSA